MSCDNQPAGCHGSPAEAAPSAESIRRLTSRLVWLYSAAHWRTIVDVAEAADAQANVEENVQSKQALERELEEIGAQIDRLEMDLEHKPEYGMGKGDPLITRWELNQALLESLKKRAVSVRAALAKLDQGTYGLCERCGRPIHPDRMAALPETKLCIACARKDSSGKQATVSGPQVNVR